MDVYENLLLRAAVWSQLNGQLKFVKIYMASWSWKSSNGNPISILQSEVIIFWCSYDVISNLEHAVKIKIDSIKKTRFFQY